MRLVVTLDGTAPGPQHTLLLHRQRGFKPTHLAIVKAHEGEDLSLSYLLALLYPNQSFADQGPSPPALSLAEWVMYPMTNYQLYSY